MALTDPMFPPASRGRGALRGAGAAAVAIALSGCAAVGPSPQLVHYGCDDGREFSVLYRSASGPARIDIAGMRFELELERKETGEERYGCGVLTLWRDGQAVRVAMQGQGLYANCRPRP